MEKTKKRDFKFDKRADKYDDHFEGKLSKVFYKLIYDNIELFDSAQVLDVGCGTGTILKTLSERNNIVAHGIDVENEMIKVAKTKCPGMDIQLCSCESTHFADNSIDAVIACMAYHHFSNKSAFEKEAARILKSGARVYIADPNFPFALRKIINFLARNLNGEFFSSKEMAARFEKSGFKLAGVKKRAYGQLVVFEKL